MTIGQTFYELQLDSAGYIKDYRKHTPSPNIRGRGLGWQAEVIDPQWARDLRSSVLVIDGQGVYVSNEVLTQVGGKHLDVGPWIQFGSRKMWKLFDDMIIEMIERNGYERRSDREREVQQRNDGVIAFLIGLMSK